MNTTEMTAQSVRQRYARIKLLERITQPHTVAERARGLVELLEDPPELIAGMDVHTLLELITDPVIADRWLTAAGIFRAYTVAELPYGPKCGLLAVLRFYYV